MLDAPTMPMRRPRLPGSPAGPRTATAACPRVSRSSSRTRNTSLAIITIAAKVNSATGTAFAAAALDTTMPRSHRSGVTMPLTVPAA